MCVTNRATTFTFVAPEQVTDDYRCRDALSGRDHLSFMDAKGTVTLEPVPRKHVTSPHDARVNTRGCTRAPGPGLLRQGPRPASAVRVPTRRSTACQRGLPVGGRAHPRSGHRRTVGRPRDGHRHPRLPGRLHRPGARDQERGRVRKTPRLRRAGLPRDVARLVGAVPERRCSGDRHRRHAVTSGERNVRVARRPGRHLDGTTDTVGTIS